MGEPLIQARSIVKSSAVAGELSGAGRSVQPILDQVGLTIEQASCVGLIGECGSGRTTLAKILAGLVQPDEGAVVWLGKDIATLNRGERKTYRRAIQYVFPDPLRSMNPRQTVRVMLAASMRALTDRDKKSRTLHTEEVLDQVGLSSEVLDWHPHRLSHHQLQQAAIARALAVEPDLLIVDETVSAVDVSAQIQRLNMLTRIRKDLGIAYLLISDNLPVVERLCDQVTVLKAGRVVEQGSSEQVLNRPSDAYTRQLCAAVPRLPGASGI